MYRNRAVRIWSASNDLPCPRDWLLSSFSPIQIEESLMRACFAPNSPPVATGEVLQVAPPNSFDVYSEYVHNFDQYFESSAKFWYNLVVFASPATHHPIYVPFRNTGLSLHLFSGIEYRPYTFRRLLRSAMFRFLKSPNARITPPNLTIPPDEYGMRDAHIPVRMFIIKLEDVCCPGAERICKNTLTAAKTLYTRLPKFNYLPYTASAYLATMGGPRTLDLVCVGYQKRISVMPRPAAFQ